MTNKEMENLFWNCSHYGKILLVNDFDFQADDIYVSIFHIEYEGEKYIFIKRNGVTIHCEKTKRG